MPKQNTRAAAATSVNIVVSPEIRQFFTELRVNGHGGFQLLARNLGDALRDSSVLHLTPDEFRRIVRYATDYGDGGFQQKLRKIVCDWVAQHMDKLV